MRPLTILASYPRSGNTFLRAVLANYDSGLDRALTADEITHYGFGEKSEPFWQACTGQEAAGRTLQMEWTARETYLGMSRAIPGDGPLMFKTHALNGVAFGAEAFHLRPDDRIVYIVRHPFDVAISGRYFFGISLEAMVERMLLPGAYNNTEGLAPYEATGSWLENAAGWLNEKRCPLMLVHYADLVADTGGQLRRVLEFLKRPIEATRIKTAGRFSNFAQLQQSQIRDGFDQGPRRDRHASFFRVGASDQWKTELPAPLARKLDTAFGPLMDVLNYERLSREKPNP